MRAVRLTPAAREDLSGIWDFTCSRWDAAQAERHLRELGEAMDRVAADPVRGRACDEVRVGYRRYPVGSHCLYYRVQDDGIDVVRVLHQRMEPTLHL